MNWPPASHSPVTKGESRTHNVDMPDASGHFLSPDNQGLWQRHVQLSRGHWRREDAAGAIRSVWGARSLEDEMAAEVA